MSLSEHFAMSRLRDIEKNNACKLTEPVDGPTFWVGPEVDFLKTCGGNGRLKRAGKNGQVGSNGQVSKRAGYIF